MTIMFKRLAVKGFIFMALLFNSLLKYSHFPLKWTLIQKPGKDKTNHESYRPISILTTLLNIFVKVLHMRLQYYLNSADTIPKFKFGFRPNFLFNIYISNILQYPRTNITLFADDKTIFSCTEAITHNLNDHLNVLST